MPVFRQETAPQVNWFELCEALVRELTHPSQAPGAPVIFEEVIPQNGMVRVLVVWDEFRAIPPESRSRLITEAYEKAGAGAPRLNFPIGVTMAEALKGGYLPYAVVTTIRGSDPVDLGQVRQAMRDAGAWETPQGLQLRFPFRPLAEKALQTLRARLGADYFTLAEDLGPVGKWLGKTG